MGDSVLHLSCYLLAGDSVSSMAITDLLLHKAKRERPESFLAGRMSQIEIEEEGIMRFRLWASNEAFSLGIVLLLVVPVAFAAPKDDVAAATMKWADTLAQDDPDKILPLYATDAVLWGTLSPAVRNGRAAMHDYFVTAFKVLPGLKVNFGDQVIRVYGSTAINTGYYTFSYVKDGETKTLPARYSFTYVLDGDNWMIVDHHSSAMPSPPK